ncbi:MAG TPA: Kazal-type serine protease inhibitor domain-containing protein, partial [Cytophagales bacterium]|nr:Kazal-type serine protease inhibitor domain-containing protein [Cytophagales bacterium]
GAVCTQQYDPVCGCDRVTYANPCLAEAAGVTRYVKGACHSYITSVLSYSYTGPLASDGCGSVFTSEDGHILIPEKEEQVPDSIKTRQTFAPAKYQVEYQIIGYNDRWQCGMNPELKKVAIIRIRKIVAV